jgi:hypothetical protein
VADRDHAAAGAGQEDLVGAPQFVHAQLALFHRVARGTGQLDRGAARNAFQHTLRGRHHACRRPLAEDREDVEARAFGHVAAAVGQHHRLAAAFIGLEQAHHEVQPVVVLDARVDAAGGDARRRADDQVDAAALLVGVGNPHEGHREGHEGVGAGARVA